jgi:hypothetical protein
VTTVCSVELSLCGLAVVVLQEAAEASATGDVAQGNQVGLAFSSYAAWLRQLVVQALMRALGMVVFDELLA